VERGEGTGKMGERRGRSEGGDWSVLRDSRSGKQSRVCEGVVESRGLWERRRGAGFRAGVWGFEPGWAGLVVRARGDVAVLDLGLQIWPPAALVAKQLVWRTRLDVCGGWLEVLGVGRKGRNGG
jgi:hypothetical protein